MKYTWPLEVIDMKVRLFVGLVALLVGAATMISVVSAASNGDSSLKSAFMQQQAKERAAAVAGPRAPKIQKLGPQTNQRASRQQGILDVRQGPVSASEFLVVNSWQGPVSGEGSTWYVVWAGSTGSISAAPGTPGIIVHLQTPSPDGTTFTDTVIGTFTDESADGPLSIVAVEGSSVELVSPSGRAFHFDLRVNRFS
ncbi:hypothetical protein EPN29_12130 [bacterium]|nr:MAG: hypothetical protein EPN29_12130 [bacterium]